MMHPAYHCVQLSHPKRHHIIHEVQELSSDEQRKKLEGEACKRRTMVKVGIERGR